MQEYSRCGLNNTAAHVVCIIKINNILTNLSMYILSPTPVQKINHQQSYAAYRTNRSVPSLAAPIHRLTWKGTRLASRAGTGGIHSLNPSQGGCSGYTSSAVAAEEGGYPMKGQTRISEGLLSSDM